MTPQHLHVHGPGKAGTALARMLAARGTKVVSLSGGSGVSGARAAALLGCAWTKTVPHLPEGAWLLLAPPDDALPQAAAALAEVALPKNVLAFHLSAIHDRSVLRPLAVRGVHTAAFHPLRALVADGPLDLGGAMVAIDAAPECAEQMQTLAVELGGHPLAVQGAQRTAYHLGAALAGNGPVALLELAVEVWVRAGFNAEDARRELSALALMALSNATKHGPAALTGPVQRGDVGTVQRHLTHMQRHHAEDAELLRATYAVLLRVAAAGSDARKAAAMAHLLGEERP